MNRWVSGIAGSQWFVSCRHAEGCARCFRKHRSHQFPQDSRRTIMMVARWSIDAKFGYKQDVIDLMQRWLREIGPQAGFSADKTRLVTGSIGALEAPFSRNIWSAISANLPKAGKNWLRLRHTSNGARISSPLWFPGPAAGRSSASYDWAGAPQIRAGRQGLEIDARCCSRCPGGGWDGAVRRCARSARRPAWAG